MALSKVMDNALALIIIGAFFYIIYLSMKSQNFEGWNRLRNLFNFKK